MTSTSFKNLQYRTTINHYRNRCILDRKNYLHWRRVTAYLHSQLTKTLMVFDNTIFDMLSNKKVNPIVTESFVRGRKLFRAFITQFYFGFLKKIRLNSTHYFIMKIPSKWDFQQIIFNHSSDTELKDLKSDSHLLKKFCIVYFIEKPFYFKNAFYFILKALLVLKVFKLLSWLLGHVKKNGLIRKIR